MDVVRELVKNWISLRSQVSVIQGVEWNCRTADARRYASRYLFSVSQFVYSTMLFCEQSSLLVFRPNPISTWLSQNLFNGCEFVTPRRKLPRWSGINIVLPLVIT